MASPRSLIANWHYHDPYYTEFQRPSKKINGRFWQSRKMNNYPSDASVDTGRDKTPPMSMQTMSQTDESTKQPPQSAPSLYSSLLPTPDYERVFHRFHKHTLSDSTNTTGSNESSPTTTISTVDDSSATETSPGSSPESPPPTTFAVGMLRPRTADDSNGFFELQKQPPPRKGRNLKNLKNLAVNTSRQPPPRAASTTSLPLESQPEMEPSILSPSFVKPPTPPRRRPSNLGLTLLTPGASKPPPQEVRLTIPPTPGFGRPGMLRHFQSSPSLPLVPGLGLSHLSHGQSPYQQRTLDTIFSPTIQSKEAPQIEEEDEQNFDVPLSREEKPEAYPDGPICVYDPSIDLYLEPTAEQARGYDVIMNVASEVRNPFLTHNQPSLPEPDLRLDGGGGIQYAPKRPHLSAQNSNTSSMYDSSPTTPKATPLDSMFPKVAMAVSQTKEPEYIHIPWEHNSDIVPDLLRLVKLIDDKVNEGKRVLIHCQCGVSRSASLVVAYGLYKNPTLSVQEAYDAVKKRSKWIGPNMNLIMQLQEFRSSLERGGVLPSNRCLSPMTPSSALSEWRGPFSEQRAGTDEPMSAVFGPQRHRQQSASLQVTSPGPSSAPSGNPWPANTGNRGRSVSAVKPNTAYDLVPLLKVVDVEPIPKRSSSLRQPVPEKVPSPALTESSLSSPRSAEFAMTSLHPTKEADPADDFGIMSPTSTEFASNPFDRTALLASLGMGTMHADEETPRRSLSLKSRERQQVSPSSTLQANPGTRLRGKISSPSLREQQQLQSLQAKIEASLHLRNGPSSSQDDFMDDALMSPRATEFTDNPFALPAPSQATKPASDVTTSSRATVADPRSPAQKGQSPIIRNIYDVL